MKKSAQKYLAISTVFFILAFGLIAYFYQHSLLWIWLIGILIGFILYRSGLCFAAMYQNLFLFHDPSMMRGALIMIFISFMGISLIQFYAYINGQVIPGEFHSVGIHTAVGSFLFGLGMVCTGSCAAGTLQRIGEGFILFLFVLIGLLIGSTWGAYHFSWWVNNFINYKPVFLPDVFGWLTSWLLSAFVIISIFCLTFVIKDKNIFHRFMKRSGKHGRKKISPSR